MVKEFNMMRAQEVHKLVEWPLSVNIIGMKWVYIPKFDSDSRLLDRKARIVAHVREPLRGKHP